MDMDNPEAQKVANRKKILMDADKLREKVSRASKTILKLRAAQEAENLRLKQRLQQSVSNNEKLHQNMVELQMQNETVSNKYEEELRLRPETLKKLTSTCCMCDALEECSKILRDTLFRCKEDKIALHEAYQKCGQLVRDINAQFTLTEEKNRQAIAGLQDKLKLSTDHNAQMQEFFSSGKQRMDAELFELRSKLAGMTSHRDEMLAACNELERKLESNARDVEKSNEKQETIASLQKDIIKLIQDFHSEGTEMKNINLKLEKDIQEATSSNEALKQALATHEVFTKNICDHNSQMIMKVAALEEEKVASAVVVKDLEAKLEILSAAQAEIQDLKKQIYILDNKNRELTKTQDNKVKDMVAKVQQLITSGQEADQKIHVIENTLGECKDVAAERINQLTTTIQGKDEELNAKAAAINQLMADKDAAAERERILANKVEMLEGVVKNKDAELTEQINVNLELRKDKDRLRATIEQMKLKINNVQKELAAPPKRVTEQDDSAVIFTAIHNLPPESPIQRPNPNADDFSVFDFNSDDSNDNDRTLDPTVHRRFATICHGEPFPPMPSTSTPHRRSGPATRGLKMKTIRPKKSAKNDKAISIDKKDDAKNKENKFFKSKRQ